MVYDRKGIFFLVFGASLVEFSEMQLRPELVEALKGVGFTKATEVQERAIPEILRGKSVMVRAKTGTGKTGAFLIPVVQMMTHPHGVEALVIVPTRELALQVSDFAQKAFQRLHIRTATVYGGASMNVQMQMISSGANIIVGTPGRLIDLIERGALDLGRVRYVILDEADIMLDMGFIEDVEYILSRTPRQKMLSLFSATMPHEITDIASRHIDGESVRITVGEEEDLTVETIQHGYFIAGGRGKFAALLAYIDRFSPRKAIIFAATKREADVVHRFLVGRGIKAIVMHGDLTQAMRERSLGSFRQGAQFLIATNIASRGLDIADVTDIINFDIPDDPHVYVHRVGRSARMGKEGRAFSLVRPEERNLLKVIEYMANVKINPVNLDTKKFDNVEVPQQGSRWRGGGSGGGYSRDRDRDRGRGGYGGHRPYNRFGGHRHGRNRDFRHGHESRE